MTSIVKTGIAGTGHYVPERVVPNSWFEGFLDTSDEWIVQRTGIKERRYVADDEATSDLCVKASLAACEAASVAPEDLDAIIVGTLTPDYQLPSCAALVQDKLGAKSAMAFDVSSACTGFVNAMQVGAGLIGVGQSKRVLAIGAEVLSRYLDFEDRGSCILFGDGAGAALLQPHDDCQQGEILRSTMGTDGSSFNLIQIPGGGSVRPPTAEVLKDRDHLIHIDGRGVYRFAVSKMSEMIATMMEGLDPDEICLVVPHQVNRRIIDAAVERVDLGIEKVMLNIDRYANTSAATVPIALDEAFRSGRLEKGKYVILVAFGAGVTWGASLLRW